jgi:membrane protease YdiL (CAAX protease family)
MKHSATSIPAPQRRYGGWLTLLMALFAFRVLAQPVAAQWHVALLPSFDDWHSGAVPYPLLLISQCLILFVGIAVTRFFYRRELSPRRRLGTCLLYLGWIYWGVMSMRLLLGVTLLNNVHWFTQTLPALFHLLLANFLMLVGEFLRRQNQTGITV